MELVVAMLLMSIVVSMGYLGLKLVTGQFNEFNQASSNSTTFTLLNTALTKDFEKSTKVILSEEGIVCERQEGTAHYFIMDNQLIRKWNEGQIDTFNFRNVNHEARFQHILQDSIGGPVDQLTLRLAFQKDTLSLIIYKEYDAHSLFNSIN